VNPNDLGQQCPVECCRRYLPRRDPRAGEFPFLGYTVIYVLQLGSARRKRSSTRFTSSMLIVSMFAFILPGGEGEGSFMSARVQTSEPRMKQGKTTTVSPRVDIISSGTICLALSRLMGSTWRSYATGSRSIGVRSCSAFLVPARFLAPSRLATEQIRTRNDAEEQSFAVDDRSAIDRDVDEQARENCALNAQSTNCASSTVPSARNVRRVRTGSGAVDVRIRAPPAAQSIPLFAASAPFRAQGKTFCDRATVARGAPSRRRVCGTVMNDAHGVRLVARVLQPGAAAMNALSRGSVKGRQP
jgi:hypothetical protein